MRENTVDHTGDLVAVGLELCLFVPTKISAIARKFLKKLGVPDGI
jgi:hypothetical protein